MGSLFSKPKSKKARSSAAQIVTLCDQHGVPVKVQKISDSFVQKGTAVQIKPNITTPATRTELYIATPELLEQEDLIKKRLYLHLTTIKVRLWYAIQYQLGRARRKLRAGER